jgi:hypothetical protein
VSTRDLDRMQQPTSELPPIPPEGDAAPRRWSTGHTVAAAVVAVGVLASGGVAWAARDSTAATTGPGGVGTGGFGQQQPGGRGGFGQQPGQLPGPGQLGGPPQPPGQLTQDDGGVHT